MRSGWCATLWALLLLQPSYAQAPAARSGGGGEVVVQGHLTPHCRALADDPLDVMTEKAPRAHWVRIEPNPNGSGYHYVFSGGQPAASSLTPVGQWRRAGNALYHYIFRQPTDGTPLCLGRRRPTRLPDESDEARASEVVVTAKTKRDVSGAQLQQILHAEPYLCRSVRLTVNLASRDTAALLWFNGGYHDAQEYWLEGTSGWKAIRLEQLVPWWSPWIGFGVGLARGDVWIDKARFEIVPAGQLPIEQQQAQKACRWHLSKSQLAAQAPS